MSTVVCVVGSGGREHALATVLGRTADVVATPGNPGITGRTPDGHRLSSSAAPPEEIEADLYVIGPEAPLVDGLADRLRAAGRLVFGPGADGARLEGSKEFMKQLCSAAGVPTARYEACGSTAEARRALRSLPGPYVVKTDGLAAGKGVLVTADLHEAEADADAKLSGSSFGAAGRRVVIEEALSGPEVSVLAVCDGRRAVALPPAQDFKALGDGGTGPNTGGMGAYSPVPIAGRPVVEEVMEHIVEPTLNELRRRGVDYRGVLYAGVILTAEGAKLIEFNARFGDPEAEVVLLLEQGDLTEMLAGAAGGRLDESRHPSIAATPEGAAVCVVLAAPGYPHAPVSGIPIRGLEEADRVEGVTVFHAGTRLDPDGVLRTAGGRVVSICGRADSLAVARERAYDGVRRVHFDGMQFRSDVAGKVTVPR